MPTILDPGTVRLSNADVLHWISQKRTQHALDAQEDKAVGRKKTFQPDNYQRALRKHERELSARKYPYTDNPGAYAGDNRIESMKVFVEKLDELFLTRVEEKYKSLVAGGEMNEAAAGKAMEREMEGKGLSEAEMLQVYNLAPQAVEILQNILVDWEERFSSEEMEEIVDMVGKVFRCGETLPEGSGRTATTAIKTLTDRTIGATKGSQSAPPPMAIAGEDNTTQTRSLSPHSQRMLLPEVEVGEEEFRRIDEMQWVGLPELSGGNRVPLGREGRGVGRR